MLHRAIVFFRVVNPCLAPQGRGAGEDGVSRVFVLLLVTSLVSGWVLSGCGGGDGGSTPMVGVASPSPTPPGGIADLCDDCYYADQIESYRYQPYMPLMARVCDRGPLYVTGSERVSWEALCAAGDMLAAMLAHRPDVAQELQAHGAVTTVFALAENVCSTDYFADLRGEEICYGAPGGLGGVLGNPATACSEANIMSSPLDAFVRGGRRGENVCVHELAHTIMNVGLSDQDRLDIANRYEQVMLSNTLWVRSDGTWTYARQNHHELFAELAQVYFSANPQEDHFVHNGVNGPSALLIYDPESFVLVDRIFVRPANLR